MTARINPRLAQSKSPYLKQHAGNPVDWWQWSDDAFAEAKRRGVPVFLSVGYAACHWCHVMARESFEDADIAAFLNDNFVSIKVDREERPDVDAVYMAATTAMTGQGGWPMTCFLDHDRAPFFAGTYYPPEARHGLPSFPQVLTGITQAWTNRGDEVAAASKALREHLAQEVSLTAATLDDDALGKAVTALATDFDNDNGGFGSAPKFPPSMVCEFLQRHSARTGSHEATRMLDHTLDAMARGGIYDHLGGGFSRYSVDGQWQVPHFEKMLFDNALLLSVYAHWDTPLGRRVTRETADFLLSELRTSQGGFASALDADTEGREGAFYVWTPDQLTDVLGADDGRWAADTFNVTDAGNFDDRTSTLQLLTDPDDAERFRRVRAALVEARSSREAPARDDKVVASWNGLAINALCAAGWSTGETRYLDAALMAGRLLRDLHLVDGRLRRVSRDGQLADAAGVAEDYGCVADAFVTLFELTSDLSWLESAGDLLDVGLERFSADDGGFFDTADDAEVFITRPRELADNAYPSGQSALARALLRYGALTGSARHSEAAQGALEALSTIVTQAPRFAGWVLSTAELALAGAEVIVVAGQPGPGRDDLAAAARDQRPAATVVTQPGRTDLELLRGRGEVQGRPAAYVCRDQVCGLPVTDPAALV